MYNLLLSIILFAATPFQNVNEAPAVESKSVIVVVNTADWCPTCQKNGPRVEKELLSSYMKDDNYTIIVNNLSTDETKMASQKMLEEVGLSTFTDENNGTGSIYFIHPETKKVIDKISVRKSTEKLKAAFAEALAEL